MIKNTILFSTGVCINYDNNFDHTLLFKLIPALITPKFEIFVSDYYVDRQDEYDDVSKIVLRAKELGALFPVMHMNQRIGTLISRNNPGDIERALKLFQFNCEYAVKYDAKLLVMHLWGGEWSDKNIYTNIRMFSELKAISDKYNLTLTIENVVCNTYKPLDHIKRLWNLYGNDVRITLDVRHAEFHKSLEETCETDFLWENNLVLHVHISDYGGGNMEWEKFLGNNTPITFGNVDFNYFFTFLKSVDYSGSLTIENNRISSDKDLIYNFNKAYEFVEKGLSK